MEEKKPQNQTPLSAHDQNQTSPAESKSSGLKPKLPWIIIAILLVLLGAFGAYFVMNQNKQAQTTTPTPATRLILSWGDKRNAMPFAR